MEYTLKLIRKVEMLVFIVILLVLAVKISLLETNIVDAQESYEYYGYMPHYFNYTGGLDVIPIPTSDNPNPGWRVNGTAYVDIVGYEDGTNIAIYDIVSPKEPKLLAEAKLNKMALYTFRMAKGTYFKILSNKPIAVSIGGGTIYEGSGTSVFYPSVDGGFAGTDFIIMAFRAAIAAETTLAFHTVHAIEDAHVTIYDTSGKVLWEKDVPANTSRSGIGLDTRKVYRVVSTGRIMFANWVGDSYVVLPDALGGYAGNSFWTMESAGTRGRSEEVVLVVLGQSAPAKVKVFDPTGDVFWDVNVEARKLWLAEGAQTFRAKNAVIISTGKIMVFSGVLDLAPSGVEMTRLHDDVTFFGVRPNETTTFYIPSKGVVFSPESDARITMSGLVIAIQKGGYAAVPSGLTTLTSNTTLIIEAVAEQFAAPGTQEFGQAATSFGAYLITSKTVNVVYPPPKVKEQGLPFTQIAAGVIVAAVVVVLLAWKKPWKQS